MLINVENELPKNLISLAKKKRTTKIAIVCANQFAAMQSAKEAYDINLIDPIFIGKKNQIHEEAEKLNWNIGNFKIINEENDHNSANIGAKLAKDNLVKVIVKGNLHTDILMRSYLKKEYNLMVGKRLSHIWHMTIRNNDKPIFITDGALNVLPRIDVKMNILLNAVEFTKKTGIEKPRVAVLSGTEDPIASMPSSIEAKKIMELAVKEKIDAFVHGPLAFDNAVSLEAAKIKNINNDVAGKADILLVPNLETGNALCKMMVYFMGACAAGIVVGGKVPVVVASRADNTNSRLASIAASIIAAQ